MLTGSSQKTEIGPCSTSTNGTTAHINTRTGGCATCLRGQEKKSSYELVPVTQDLFGEVSSAMPESEESIAHFSAMKTRRCYRQSLSDRLTSSLMRSGLVAGITPTSIRRRCGAKIPATAFLWRGGRDAVSPQAENSSSKGSCDATIDAVEDERGLV